MSSVGKRRRKGERADGMITEERCREGERTEQEEGTSDMLRKTSVSVSISRSLSDLFYLPSACRTRDKKRMINNRGEMEEKDAAFLLHCPPPPFFCETPFFILTVGQN